MVAVDNKVLLSTAAGDKWGGDFVELINQRCDFSNLQIEYVVSERAMRLLGRSLFEHPSLNTARLKFALIL